MLPPISPLIFVSCSHTWSFISKERKWDGLIYLISKEKQISHLSYLEKRSHFISFLSASNETARAIGYVLTGLLTSLATWCVIGFRSISVSTSPSRDHMTCIDVTIIFNAKLRLKLDFSPGCNLKTKTPTKTLYLFLFLNPKTSVWNNLWIWTFFITFIHNN